jgi:hypothetical protein
MKLQLIAAALLASATLAHAHLIQLTPGGFSSNAPLTQQEINAYRELPPGLDLAAHGFFNLPPPEGITFLDGWSRHYGGTYLQVYDFFGHDVTSAAVSWDLTGEPHGYWMTNFFVFGSKDGELWNNFYRVPHDERFEGFGTVIAHAGVNINGIGFYGRNVEIPEGGATLGLFLLGLSVVLGGWRLFETHYVNDIVRRTKLQ